MTHPFVPRLIALACASALCLPVFASEGHGEPPAAKAAAKPAEKVAVPEKAAAPEPGSLDALREKLAARLGAVKAPESRNPNVLRVANKSGETGVLTAGAVSHGAGISAARQVAKAEAAKPDPHGHSASPAAPGLLPGQHDSHWDYVGDNGPEAWGRMKPEFSACTSGQRQSPIDIRDGIQVQLQPIEFDYRPTGFAVIDNGHTVQVNLSPGNSITIGARRYDLLQFHFHRPSEERINGRQFDMVAHLVHKDPEGRLAVVAVLLDRGSAQPVIQTVWNALPLEKGEAAAAPVAIDMNQLLPEDRRYYTYMGSLTTPPCSEGVLWMVMKKPVPLSPDQINIFARLYPMNARPIQRVAGRLIKESN